MRAVLGAIIGLVLLAAGAAADPKDPTQDKPLADPVQESEARAFMREIRCVVCQSQSIDESDAPLAHDLRQLVRAQVAQGRSDDQIRAFLVARYGQFVLLTPKASLGNAILWVGPALVVLVGAGALLARRRRMAPAQDAPLSAQEEAKLSQYFDADET